MRGTAYNRKCYVEYHPNLRIVHNEEQRTNVSGIKHIELEKINVKEMCGLKKSTFTNWADLKQSAVRKNVLIQQYQLGQSEGTGPPAATTTTL